MSHALQHPRSSDGLVPGAGLALLVHGVLIGVLALGVDWRQQTPVSVGAELWAALPEVAAPRAPEPLPATVPAPAPAPAPPVVTTPAAPPPAPDIALEKQRAQARQAEADRAAAEAERDRTRRQESAKAKDTAKAQARQKEDDKARALAQAEAEAAAADEKRLEIQRQENLKRLLAQAGGTGRPDSTGVSSRDAAPSAAYADLLRTRIRRNLKGATDGLPSTLETVVEVRSTASGTVLSRKLVKGSGNPAWDAMVMRAVEATDTLPRDEAGRVPTTLEIIFRPHER